MKPKAPGKRSKRPKRSAHTDSQLLLAVHLRELGLETVLEYKFCADRKWCFDLYLPEQRIGLECDGGMWSGGHKRGKKLIEDYEKQNTAQLMGYRILRFANEQVDGGDAKKFIAAWLSDAVATNEEAPRGVQRAGEGGGK